METRSEVRNKNRINMSSLPEEDVVFIISLSPLSLKDFSLQKYKGQSFLNTQLFILTNYVL